MPYCIPEPWLRTRRGYNTEVGEEAVASGHADAVAFGRRFLATPDMVKRVRLHAPLNQYHRDTFYTQDQARLLSHWGFGNPMNP